jgi:prevent-host-death family protein
MPTYNIYEAKTSFSKLVEQATRGEEVVIAKAGRPVLRMVPIVVEEPAVPARRVFGQMRWV